MPQRQLEGLSCLIVGGTSGIGLAAARRFLESGARVMVGGLEEHAGAAARAGLDQLGPVWEETLDVAQALDVGRLLDRAVEQLGGRLDVLLHAAGISGRKFGDGPLHECSDEGWRRVMAINAEGVFRTNRGAVERMLRQRRDSHGQRGAIVNVGSVIDRSPSPGHFDTVAYASSKGAVRALTLASAARYASEGVRFNLVEPGLVNTPMAARAVEDRELAFFRSSKQPLTGGALWPFDVADAAVYLASAAARGVTGATITVDGGWCVSDGQDHGP